MFSSTMTLEQAQHEVFDCMVIGSGPAGSAAAIHLARAGLRVLAVDKASFPREKACGDAIMSGSLAELKRLGLLSMVAQHYRALSSVTIEYNGQRVSSSLVDPNLDTAGCYLVPRAEFDAFLLQQALDSGVQWLGATEIQRIEYQYSSKVAEGDGTEGMCSGKNLSEMLLVNGIREGIPCRLRAKAALIATGTTGRIELASPPAYAGEQSQLLLPANDASRQVALRAYFDFHAATPKDGQSLYFSFDRRGRYHYLWLFPDGERANVGIIATYAQSRRYNLKAILQEELHRLFPAGTGLGVQRSNWLAAPLATGLLGTPFIEERTLYIGDAAATIDPNTGEGIAGALWSARVASETLLRAHENDDYSQAALMPYVDALRGYAGRLHYAEKLLLPAGQPAFF